MIQEITCPQRRREIAQAVLFALPEWFGLPESTAEYVRLCGAAPFWTAMVENRPVGFIAMKETSPCTAEILVMGVLPQYHRHGLGRALWQALYSRAQSLGYEFLQVKTVRQGRYPEYDRTNAFYRALGFRELECFPTLWDAQNPCQIYIMSIK